MRSGGEDGSCWSEFGLTEDRGAFVLGADFLYATTALLHLFRAGASQFLFMPSYD